jgi:hypothetical protein
MMGLHFSWFSFAQSEPQPYKKRTLLVLATIGLEVLLRVGLLLITITLAVSLGGCVASTTSTPSPSASPSSTQRSEYPKEVPISSLDERFHLSLGADRGKTVAVQLAPGVYTERSTSGDLGTLEDYSAYVGLCVDVKRYAELHPGGYTCW